MPSTTARPRLSLPCGTLYSTIFSIQSMAIFTWWHSLALLCAPAQPHCLRKVIVYKQEDALAASVDGRVHRYTMSKQSPPCLLVIFLGLHQFLVQLLEHHEERLLVRRILRLAVGGRGGGGGLGLFRRGRGGNCSGGQTKYIAGSAMDGTPQVDIMSS